MQNLEETGRRVGLLYEEEEQRAVWRLGGGWGRQTGGAVE